MAVSGIHLYKYLLKSKRISTSPAFLSELAVKLARKSENSDIATANVTARLFNSNPVKTAMAGVLANIHRELGLAESERPPKRKRLRAVDYENQVLRADNEAKSTAGGQRAAAAGGETTSNSDVDPQRQHRRLSVSNYKTDSNSEGIDYGHYQSRLADSEDDEEAFSSAEESSKAVIHNGKAELHSKGYSLRTDANANIPQYHPSKALSPSPSLSASQSPSPSAASHDARPSKSISTVKASSEQTTFLPSLIGGYWSGSESAPEEDDNLLGTKPRKNRRGQQERRAIWEKKYGRGAKHLQRQSKALQQNRDEGWDARRGASDGRGSRSRGIGWARGGIRRGGNTAGSRGLKGLASGANGEMMRGKRVIGRGGNGGEKPKSHDASLHPSWEAKKKAKEKAGSNVVTFQGRKVVFD